MPRNAAVAIAVVLPWDGSAPLAQALGRLAQQEIPGIAWETIVSVFASRSAAAQEILSTRLPTAKLVVSADRQGRGEHTGGVLRNAGAHHCTASRLIFLDSDALAAPSLVYRHWLWGQLLDAGVVCGAWRDLPIEFHGDAQDMDFPSLTSLADDDYRKGKAAIRETTWQDCYGGNFSVSTDAFNLVGGFDETGYRCHDMELAYRLSLKGARFLIDESCVAIHLEHRRSLYYRVSQEAGWRLIGKRHPEIASVVERKIEGTKRYFADVANYSRQRFQEFCERASMHGIQTGSVLIAHSPKDASSARDLAGVPTLESESHGRTWYHLRLHRDCWDYAIVSDVTIDQPYFSVLIPFFNPGPSLSRAVDSVLSQTFRSFELILIDDGSTDGAVKNVRHALCLRNVRLCTHLENHGLAAALDLGARVAQGTYVVQLDSDDLLLPGALDELYRASKECPTAVALFGGRIIDPRSRGDEETHPHPSTSASDLLTARDVYAPRAYLRTALQEVGGWPRGDAYLGRYFEDRWMLSRMARVGPVVSIPNPVYVVSARSDSLSRRNRDEAAAAKLGILLFEGAKSASILKWEFGGKYLRGTYCNPVTPAVQNWSVIIPFRERAELLRLCLQGWKDVAERSRGHVEIIIVPYVDGAAKLQSTMSVAGVRILAVPGLATAGDARNLGVANASFESIFFCDADHIVPPHVLEVHEALRGDDPKLLVQGGTLGARFLAETYPEIDEEGRRRALTQHLRSREVRAIASSWAMDRKIEVLAPQSGLWSKAVHHAFVPAWQRQWLRLYLRYGDQLSGFGHRWLRLGTGNLSMMVTAFREVGPFREDLASMEDWEWSARADDLGYSLALAHAAEPLHALHPRDPRRGDSDFDAALELRNSHWGRILVLAQDAPAEQPPGSGILLAKRRHPNRASTPTKLGAVCLTFDDGPVHAGTQRVLEMLTEYAAIATFFVLGAEVEANRSLLREMAAQGHEIGVHAWSHQKFVELSDEKIVLSVSRTANLVADLTGVMPKLCRPPYGVIDERVRRVLRSLGFGVFGWHTMARDWLLARGQNDAIVDLAAQGLLGKAVLFHDGGAETFAGGAVEWTLKTLRDHEATAVSATSYLTALGCDWFEGGLERL